MIWKAYCRAHRVSPIRLPHTIPFATSSPPSMKKIRLTNLLHEPNDLSVPISRMLSMMMMMSEVVMLAIETASMRRMMMSTFLSSRSSHLKMLGLLSMMLFR